MDASARGGRPVARSACRSASNRDHLLGVHAQLGHLERHAPPHRLGLLGDIHHVAAAFPHALQQFVAPERLAHRFVRSIGEVDLDRGPGRFGLCGHKVVWLIVRGEQGFEAFAQDVNDLDARAASRRQSSPGVFDQDATHRLGRRAEEMRAILKGRGISAAQPHPGLVDEGGGLERMAGRFVGHLPRR